MRSGRARTLAAERKMQRDVLRLRDFLQQAARPTSAAEAHSTSSSTRSTGAERSTKLRTTVAARARGLCLRVRVPANAAADAHPRRVIPSASTLSLRLER